MHRFAAVLACALVLLPVNAGVAAADADWPQWRGPARDGMAPHFTAPAAWPETLERAWRTALGGGYASPVVAGGALFVHGREDEHEVVYRLALDDGRVTWSARYRAPFTRNSYAVKHGKGPYATPLVAGGTLYTVGVTGVVSAFDAARGTLRWRHDGSGTVDTSRLFCGTSASPLLDGDQLIVHLGDDGGGALVALDAANGAVRWRQQGDGPGYASPIVVELAGTRQLVTLTDHAAIGVRAADGAPLWRLDFPDEWNENIVTPIVHRERLIFAGVRRGSFAVALEADGKGALTPRVVWDRPDLPFYMSTPVIVDDVLYGLSNRDKGRFVALDPATGETRWQGPGRQAAQAALLAADGHLLALTDGGELIVARASPRAFTEVARYTVAESATWTQPAVLADGFLVRDAGGVSRWRLPTASEADSAVPAESADSADSAAPADSVAPAESADSADSTTSATPAASGRP